MNTLYLECNMGIAGDMLAASLIELCPDPEAVLDKLNNMGLKGVEFKLSKVSKYGICGNNFSVVINGEEEVCEDVHEHEHEHHHHHEHEHEHEHHHEHEHEHHHEHHHEHSHSHHHHHAHYSMRDIENIISGLNIDEKIKSDVLAVYKLIAGAESKVHGTTVTDIHFHEVGRMDAIADITAACLMMRVIAPDRVVVSPIHVGSGHVKCAHGILPVPAPATAILLEGIPSYGGEVKGELCTPTGAALVKYFANEFGYQPVMNVRGIGYGMGKKDFSRLSCVRAMLGSDFAQKVS